MSFSVEKFGSPPQHGGGKILFLWSRMNSGSDFDESTGNAEWTVIYLYIPKLVSTPSCPSVQ